MAAGIIQIAIYIIILLALTPVLGTYIAKVFANERTFMTPLVRPIERTLFNICSINENEGMDWRSYTWALILSHIVGFIFLYIIQICQAWLPLNPNHMSNVPWDLALNTTTSFVTNTNWQAYGGETTLSYLSQMLGLTVQNFLSAAKGIAVLLAFTRGLTNKSVSTLGNFWVDIIRSLLYLFIPLSIIISLLLAGQGVVQTFSPNITAITIQGEKQVLPLGPVASQVAIKQLGTNGGGFYNTNSAHPYENPTPISNLLEMLAILLIPAALVFAYGIMIKNRKHAWLLFWVMLGIWVFGLGIAMWSEYGTATVKTITALEGQETRFGVTNSLIWSTATTVASNGSVNAMHSSLSPIAGGIAMFNMMLGEIIFGGIGSGLYGMILFVILTVFLAGLMVGRTPEYLGKKIEAKEVKMVIAGILLPSIILLIGAGVSCVLPQALSSLSSKGPHGFSEILYAFTSASENNGSAFAGLNANTLYFNLFLSLAMLIGRFGVMIPVMMIAGSMATKKITPPSSGTFSTDDTLFAILLVGVIFIVGVLTFFPALSLGPIIEHLLMIKGRVF